VPILFRERREGHSKMTARIAVEAVWKVPALRFRR
jgi:dolichol-phosphate mannosyltransferase